MKRIVTIVGVASCMLSMQTALFCAGQIFRSLTTKYQGCEHEMSALEKEKVKLHYVLNHLLKVAPPYVRELYLHSQCNDYQFSTAARECLDQYAFFNQYSVIHPDLQSLILQALRQSHKKPRSPRLFYKQQAIIDLAYRYPEIITMLCASYKDDWDNGLNYMAQNILYFEYKLTSDYEDIGRQEIGNLIVSINENNEHNTKTLSSLSTLFKTLPHLQLRPLTEFIANTPNTHSVIIPPPTPKPIFLKRLNQKDYFITDKDGNVLEVEF